ncbi:MAG: CusA/CzcA family heavy metal efflux RND transporter [Saprospiraceae bacterium]|nr:CusA/CzcA family heavy metal efflux RND transporter [Saprospiraceae bacterium]
MFDKIIHFSIYNRIIIVAMVIGLIIWGLQSAQNLPIDAVPDITDNQVQIITSSPDLSAQEVERLITFPLELEMGNIPEVEELRSISRFGLSVITIVFQENTDIYWAREQINQKIMVSRESIPEEYGTPEMGPITTGLGEIYQYTVYPDDGYEDQYNSTDLRSIQDWIIKRQIIGIPGVVEVNSSGGFLKQYEISVDPEKLAAFNLSLSDIFTAVESNNANSGGSYIERHDQTYFIRGEGMVESTRDLENILVQFNGHIPLMLKDVAEVKIGHAPRFGAVTKNGKGEVVAGQVMMLKGANSNQVTKLVKERMEEIKASLPEGIVIEPYLDRSKLVANTTRTVITNLSEGALIVIFILVLLLGNLRAGLIVASVIPLSMLFAIGMMRVFGVSANLMSLGAIDFGLIVDGAVIVVESILLNIGMKNRELKLSVADQKGIIHRAASRIRTSAAFGEIIILVVYLPILFLRGIEGKMFIPMAQTVSFAILGALILSTTYVPMMAATFLRGAVEKEKTLSSKIIAWLYSIYAPVRDLALKFKKIAIVCTLAIFAWSLWIMNNMGSEFIPTLDEGDFALHQILPTGSSLKKGVEVSAPLQDILTEKFPEVEQVVTKIGTAEIPTDIMPLEAGDIYVIMKPRSEWTTASTREEMFELMEEELEKFPGVIYEFTQPIQMRFNELMTGIRQDIAIKIYGEDLGILVQVAEEAESILNTIDGVGDIQVERTVGLQQMVVKYDRLAISRYGLNIDEVNNLIKTAFAGKKAGLFYEGEQRYDIVVRLAEHHRQGIESLQELKIQNPDGLLVPLSELAYIGYEEGPSQISRDNTKRRITIGVNTRNKDIATVIDDIQNRFDRDLSLPTGYYVRYGGQFENLERARGRLALVVPIALAVIFILLFFTFSSIKYALLIYTAIPLSAIGGIWALYLRGMPFSISAAIGFIALFGVAVLNGIVLIAYFNQLKKEGMSDVNEIITKGTKVRLRPVIMTASVASLGFLPMAISTTAGAEVQRPLATVVIGGLITATILTMIVVPILYSWIEKIGHRRIGKWLPIILLLLIPGLGMSQTEYSLDQVMLKIEESEHPLLRANQLNQDAFLSIAQNPLAPNPWSFSISGEEFNLDGVSGIQSLNVQKNFRLPGVKKSYTDYYNALSGEIQVQERIQLMDLKRSLMNSYLSVAYANSMISIENERLSAYQKFRDIADRLVELGQTGNLSLRQTDHQIDLIELNIAQWFQVTDQHFQFMNLILDERDWVTSDLESTLLTQIDIDIGANPFVAGLSKKKEIHLAKAKTLKSQNLPQVLGGLRLQSISGDLLYFGYQVGINVPLSGGYNKSVDQSTRLQVESIELQEGWLKGKLGINENIVSARKEWLSNTLAIYDVEIASMETLIADLEKAYQYGEVSYSDVVLGYEQLYKARVKRIESIRDYLLLLNDAAHSIK